MIKVSIAEQLLYHRRLTGVVCVYPISTASRGAGNQEGSLQTPLGKHRIHQKIGDSNPLYTFYVAREPKGIFTQKRRAERADWILTRILWLEGCQTGFNRRGQVDSRRRFIYIHGTNEEELIGSPASHGCVRMRNVDMMDLFKHVQLGESVYIKG
ncbi:MAG: L,D-transpeptidase [Mariprofundaceae bacterium]|nr:L,D-transpeptidase [Mariprofundaceae bacterium]